MTGPSSPPSRQSDEAVELVLRKHLPVAVPETDGVLCICDVTRTYLGPVGHRLHVAARLREAGMVQIPAWAERDGAEWRLVPTGSLEAIMALPDRPTVGTGSRSGREQDSLFGFGYNAALERVRALLTPDGNAPDKSS